MHLTNTDISPNLHPDLLLRMRDLRPGLSDALGMELLKLYPDEVVGSMPVDERTRQPMGLLHGGASVALSETLCSIGAWLNLGGAEGTAVGLEINANHVRAVRSGLVIGTARPVHIGSQLQVWECLIKTQDGKLVCTSRCTLMNVKRS